MERRGAMLEELLQQRRKVGACAAEGGQLVSRENSVRRRGNRQGGT